MSDKQSDENGGSRPAEEETPAEEQAKQDAEGSRRKLRDRLPYIEDFLPSD